MHVMYVYKSVFVNYQNKIHVFRLLKLLITKENHGKTIRELTISCRFS